MTASVARSQLNFSFMKSKSGPDRGRARVVVELFEGTDLYSAGAAE